MRGRLLAVGLWLCVTAAATAIVWAGTSTVAADLTDRPAPVVAHRDVVSALESGTPGADTAPGIGQPDAPHPASTVPSDGGGSARAAPAAPQPQPSPAPSPGPTTTLAPPPSPAPATGSSGTPPTTQPARPHTATYSTAGGVVSVACTDYFFIQLLSATPAIGYAVDVVTPGPGFVEVHFLRAGQDVAVRAFCLGEPTRIYDGFSSPAQVQQPSR
ncbi:MAG TPA: hypothetical protein VHS52_05460 [Acidimicrobiales bacterium]|nr:hypothetical protein [Acidimicrobiales bacterium]